MFHTGVVPTHVGSIKWQDYRSGKSGMVVYYNTDPVAELPIREIPEEIPSAVIPEPNYETKTFGLYGCKHTKLRSAFVKKKTGYLFFMTRYSGTNLEFADDLMVTGFYHIKKSSDVQKLHIRYLNEYSCVNEEGCPALLADEVHFVSVEDAYMLTDDALEAMGNTTRITRQTKLYLEDEKVEELVSYLRSKENVVNVYSEETMRLMPDVGNMDEDDDSDEFEDYVGPDFDDED